MNVHSNAPEVRVQDPETKAKKAVTKPKTKPVGGEGDSYASQPSGSTPPAQERPTQPLGSALKPTKANTAKQAGAPSRSVPAEIPGLAMPVLGEGPASREIYAKHLSILRDIITVDHFGNEMGPPIVDAWIKGLHPGAPLPTHIKGFYQGSLRASMPIELARGSLKFIMHETADREKITTYAERMLITLSTLGDLHKLGEEEPTLALAALWHKALALVRLPEGVEQLKTTMQHYEELRPKSPLPDNKLPETARLKLRLQNLATDVKNEPALAWLTTPC
jgi:hypothetical protein